MLLFTEVENIGWEQMWEENVNFYLGHVLFDMPEINPNEDVKEAVYI